MALLSRRRAWAGCEAVCLWGELVGEGRQQSCWLPRPPHLLPAFLPCAQPYPCGAHYAPCPSPTVPWHAGERAVMRAVMRTLLTPLEQLAYERNAAPYGAAKEAAVLAALQLLCAVFEADVQFVGAMRHATLAGGREDVVW